MSDKSRGCSKCLGAMDYRLGEFVCPNCGYTEPATKPAEEKKSSGPGFRREKKWIGSSQLHDVQGADPQAPDQATVFSIVAEHQFDKEESSSQKTQSFLHIEIL